MFVSLLCSFFSRGKRYFPHKLHIHSAIYIYIHTAPTFYIHFTYILHISSYFYIHFTYIPHTSTCIPHRCTLGIFWDHFRLENLQATVRRKANSASCCHRGGLGRLRTAKAPSTALKILMSWRWVLLRCLVPIVPALVHFTPEVGSGACCNRRHPQRRQQRWGWESMAEVLKRCTRFCHRSTLWYYVYKKIW